MSAPEPDLGFSFVRAHRTMIREIERRLAAAGLPAYAWYDALWGSKAGRRHASHARAGRCARDRALQPHAARRPARTGGACHARPFGGRWPRSVCEHHRQGADAAQEDVEGVPVDGLGTLSISSAARSRRRWPPRSTVRPPRRATRSRREVASAGTHVSRSHSGASPARPSRPARGRRRPAAEARPRRSSVHSARARAGAGQIRAERREAGRDERPDLRGDVPA